MRSHLHIIAAVAVGTNMPIPNRMGCERNSKQWNDQHLGARDRLDQPKRQQAGGDSRLPIRIRGHEERASQPAAPRLRRRRMLASLISNPRRQTMYLVARA